MRRGLRLIDRALLLECPNCGGGPAMASWFKMRRNYRSCGLRLERHTGLMTGSMTLSYTFGEGIVILIGVVIFAFTWPNTPWVLMEVVLITLAIIAPFAFFPFSKTLWPTFDHLVRPIEPGEVESPEETRQKPA